MINGTINYKDNSTGQFSLKSWKSLKKLIETEKDLKKINLFKPLKSLDSEIRTIELPTNKINEYIIEVGLFESLGEYGGDILTLFYKKFPLLKEIKQDISNTLKDTFKELDNSILTGREETQLKVLSKLFKVY